jgi:hypothetical protein
VMGSTPAADEARFLAERPASQDHMTSTLAGDHKAELLESANSLCAGYARKTRHSPPLEMS